MGVPGHCQVPEEALGSISVENGSCSPSFSDEEEEEEEEEASSSRSSGFDIQRVGSGVGLAKPHKANNDARWEAIQVVQTRDGAIRLTHFRLLQRLGSGDIGTVYLAELGSQGCYFALKVMDKKALSARNKLLRVQTERQILEVLDHPFLPTLYSHIDTHHFSCLVMEFCPGGDLHVLRQRQPTKRFDDAAARFYAAEVLLALEYLHMMGIVYRDLKPENVLVREDGHIMLSDFDLSLQCSVNPTLLRLTSRAVGSASPSSCTGASCVLPIASCTIHPMASCLPFPRILSISCTSSSRRKHKHNQEQKQGRRLPELVAEPTDLRSMSFVGTHEYLAPEIILGDGHGSAVDWWTFGIFLYELLYGRTPFKGPDNEATLTNVVTQHLHFPPDPEPCLAAQYLIAGLLTKDPEKRLGSVRGATEIKQHAFFEGVNWALIRCAIPPEIPSPFHRAAAPTNSSPGAATDSNLQTLDASSEFEYF